MDRRLTLEDDYVDLITTIRMGREFYEFWETNQIPPRDVSMDSAIFMFDYGRRVSVGWAMDDAEAYQRAHPNCTIILLGNKCDVTPLAYDPEEVERSRNDFLIEHCSASTWTNDQIAGLWNRLAHRMASH